MRISAPVHEPISHMHCSVHKPGKAIHLWRVRLDEVDAIWAGSLLSRDEHLLAASYRFDRDRREFVRARAVLRNVLATYSGEDPKRLQFSYTAGRKPALAGGIEFNLSRTRAVAVVAVARRPVGVDVEALGSCFAWENVAAHFFSATERNRLATEPEGRRAEVFLCCWTRREAYVKARGCGDPSEIRGLTSSVIDEQGRTWSITNVVPYRGFVGAIACEGDLPETEVFNWDSALSRVK